jgi:hypothetical protein
LETKPLQKKNRSAFGGVRFAKGKKQKGKGQEILENRNSQAKTELVATIDSIDPEPNCRATILRIIVPRTATQSSETCLRIIFIPTTSILWRIFIVFMPNVFTPFPDISVQII